ADRSRLGPRAPAFERSAMLLCLEPLLPRPRGRSGWPARARLPQRRRDQGPDLLAGVLEISGLVARRLARDHELAVGVEPAAAQPMEARPRRVGEPLDHAEVDSELHLRRDLVHVLAPGARPAPAGAAKPCTGQGPPSPAED